MKNFFLAGFILCFSIMSNAQEWVNINPSFDPPGNYNMSLGTFVDKKNGWFTESLRGRIWHTTDGGNTWEQQRDSSEVYHSDIIFIDSFHGWITGETIRDMTPFLLRTSDGGNSWEEISAPDFLTLLFYHPFKGFAGGYYYLYGTSDGGYTWDTLAVEPGAFFIIRDIYLVDRQHGWAVGPSGQMTDVGIILNTTDGGETWKVSLHPSGAIGKGVFFINRLKGFVVGYDFYGGVIMTTTNGGENWEHHYPPTPGLNDVVFTNDSTGWIVGDYGFILYTEDAGSTWEKVNSGTDSNLRRIVFVEDGNVGYIFGKDNTLLRYDRTGNNFSEDNPVIHPTFKLYQNYPNPFNSETIITYELVKTEYVKVRVYDLKGREVVILADERQTSGNYKVIWDGRDRYGKDVSSGIYFSELRARYFSQVLKMILIR